MLRHWPWWNDKWKKNTQKKLSEVNKSLCRCREISVFRILQIKKLPPPSDPIYHYHLQESIVNLQQHGTPHLQENVCQGSGQALLPWHTFFWKILCVRGSHIPKGSKFGIINRLARFIFCLNEKKQSEKCDIREKVSDNKNLFTFRPLAQVCFEAEQTLAFFHGRKLKHQKAAAYMLFFFFCLCTICYLFIYLFIYFYFRKTKPSHVWKEPSNLVF